MENSLENTLPTGQLLEIIKYPSPVLTTKALEVEIFDQELKDLCQNMLYTMYKAPGIGLAAPQIGISKRIFVVDVDYKREETEEDSGEYTLSEFNPQIFINPVLCEHEGETIFQEGCLSLPEVFEDVKRFEKVKVNYQDTDGNDHSIEADELLSICLQHENDHLDGIVFIDRLSMLKKTFLKKKLIKAKREVSHNL
jgi:peptide deformylase